MLFDWEKWPRAKASFLSEAMQSALARFVLHCYVDKSTGTLRVLAPVLTSKTEGFRPRRVLQVHIDGGAIWPTARHLLCLTVSTALLSQHDAQHRAVTGHRHQPHCCLRSSEKAWQLLSLSSTWLALTMKRKRSTCVRSLLLDAYICIRGHLTLPDRRPRFRLGSRHSGLLVLDLAWALTPHVCSHRRNADRVGWSLSATTLARCTP